MKFIAGQIIPAFDDFLNAEQLHFSGIAIGGSALAILGIIDRATRDLDLLTSPIPLPIQIASKAFAKTNGLDLNWLNDAPSELAKHLPDGWQNECVALFKGKAIELRTLSRLHLVYAKFWAMCDRERDYEDLLRIKPTADELEKAINWVKPLDGNEQWIAHVEASAQKLRLGLLEEVRDR